jgi:TrpR-related protein YerC/YecD
MDKKELELLLKSFLALETQEECLVFLEDLCTINEIEDMSHRIEIADLLNKGKTFNEVQDLTGASSTTVSRVSRCLKHGNGYKTALKRVSKMES